MAGEKYTDKAVSLLLAYVQSNLPAQLRLVETAQGLAANSLKDPEAYLDAQVSNDGSSPIILIYPRDEQPQSYEGSITYCNLEIFVGYAGDADVLTGERYVRRVVTALRDLIRANRTSNAAGLPLIDGAAQYESGASENDATYHTVRLAVEAHAHDD